MAEVEPELAKSVQNWENSNQNCAGNGLGPSGKTFQETNQTSLQKQMGSFLWAGFVLLHLGTPPIQIFRGQILKTGPENLSVRVGRIRPTSTEFAQNWQNSSQNWPSSPKLAELEPELSGQNHSQIAEFEREWAECAQAWPKSPQN